MTNEQTATARKRRSIIYAVFAFIVTCGLPMFLYTTLIHRAELPGADVETKHRQLSSALAFNVPVYVNIPTSEELLLQDVEKLANEKIQAKFNVGNTWKLTFDTPERNADSGYVVQVENSNQGSYAVSPTSKQVTLYSTEQKLTPKLATLLVDSLVDGVFNDELTAVSAILHDRKDPLSEVVMPYSGTYNVVFNLFVENGKPVEWDIEQAMKKIDPVFEALKHYSNFKISTQIQYYSKLRTEPVFDAAKNAYIIKKDDLSTFINFGDWNLNNNDKYPSINFLVYFSEKNYKNTPLLIEDSITNSFLVPQWGGVQIYNKNLPILDGSVVRITESELDNILKVFVSQLFELLGVPKNPKSPAIRIDSLHRIRTLRNLKSSLDNLLSLIKLTESLNEISVPEQTGTHVSESLDFYDRAVEALQVRDFVSAVEFSSKSVESSNKAFFEKEMVQQAYFPSEHKLAVFLPLLGPLCTIVTLGLLKSLKDRKEKQGPETELKKDI